MTLLAIIGREIRTAARRPGTFRVRFLTILVTIGVSAFVFLQTLFDNVSGEQQGRLIFHSLIQAASICSLLLGLMLTPDSVSSEKRENTLGLLFLTDLKGYHVIFGKLVAHSWNGFYSLLGILPVLAIPLLMGGVTGGDLVQVGGVLMAFLLLSVSVGIFVSTFSIREWRAIFYTALMLLALIGIPLVVGYWLDLRGMQRNEIWPLFLPSPAYVWMVWNESFQGRGPPTTRPQEYIWVMIGIQVLFAFLLILVASRRVTKSWTDSAVDGPASGLPFRLTGHWLRYSKSGRRRLLAKNPHLWLALRDPTKPFLVWIFVAAMVLIWLWTYVAEGEYAMSDRVLSMGFGIVRWFLLIWMMVEASGRLFESRQNRTLEMILTTPSGPDEIIGGQIRGLVRMFLGPAVVAGALYCIVAYYSGDDFIAPLSTTFTWLFNLGTLACVGLAASLTARGLSRAIFKTFMVGMALPSILSGLAMTIWLMPSGLSGRGAPEEGLALWRDAVHIFVDIALILFYARPILYHQFRALVAPGERQPKWV